MTQSVAQNTSILEKTWRRQTDSPKWWIVFACGSVFLHLIAFWLIGLYKLNSSQGGGSSAVPIEFIEISPPKSSKIQAKPKPVSTKPVKSIVPQNSQPAPKPRAVKPPVSTNDSDAIAFNNQKIEQQLAEQKRQQELLQQQQLAEKQRLLEAQKRQREAEQQRQLEAEQRQLAEELRQRQAQQAELEAQLLKQEQQQQRLLAEQLRQQEQEQERQAQLQRQQQVEQKRQEKLQRQQQADQKRQEQLQRQAAQQSKLAAEEQRQQAIAQQTQNPADGEKITDAPKNTDGKEPPPEFDKKASQAPIQETQLNQSGGILTASWKIDSELDFKGKLRRGNLAKPKITDSNITLDAAKDGNFKPGDFLVWLTIDNQGNLISVEVDKEIPLAQRSQYQEYAEEIFTGQKFIPASENNGDKPPLSHLPIRVNIQSSSN